MRIGFDAKRAFNNGTGLGNYSRFVISSLVKYFPEHEYFLFTPTIKSEFGNFVEPSSNIKIISPDSIIGKTFPALWRSYAIAEMCNELKLDVFHGLSNELPVGIEKFKGKKMVTTHDLIFLRYPNYYNNIDRYIYTKKFKHACEKADLVFAASEQTKNDIITFLKTSDTKIKVLYQNCDERFGEIADQHVKSGIIKKFNLPERFILCVGTMEERKDQMTVLKAFAMLKRDDVKLIFIGRHTDYTKKLKAYIEANQLNDKVLFAEQVEPQYLPAIFQLSDALIYASEFEGFGIPVLEGLRSKVPVIAADSSSLPEVGGEAALYFKAHDAEELSSLMNKVLNDKSLRDSMIAKGVVQAEKFGSKILTEQLISFYIN